MNTIINAGKHGKIDKAIDKFTLHHKIVSFFVLFAVAPIFTLAAIFSFTMAIILPIALVMGWV